jgi:hypothetical protein
LDSINLGQQPQAGHTFTRGRIRNAVGLIWGIGIHDYIHRHDMVTIRLSQPSCLGTNKLQLGCILLSGSLDGSSQFGIYPVKHLIRPVSGINVGITQVACDVVYVVLLLARGPA